MLSPVKSFIKGHLPTNVYHLIKEARDHVARLVPSPPAVQMYLNGDGVETHLGINDFYGFFVPEVHADVVLNLDFYGADGSKVFEFSRILGFGSTFEFDVKEVFAENGITSEQGIVASRLTPIKNRKYAYKRMGLPGSQFYAFYRHTKGKEAGSIGQVHPLSRLVPENKASKEFNSSQVIRVNELSGIRLLQCNPSLFHHEMEHRLLDEETKAVVLAKKTKIPPLGMAVVDFDFDQLQVACKNLLFKIDQMPSENSKPVLVRKTKSGSFSYSHS